MATRSKLAVILHADVVGSTALVQIDERIAHDRIQDAFRRFSTVISDYGGTTHERRGDAVIAAFSRASDAVCAALAFQSGNEYHNRSLGDETGPQIRVGISLGEVVFGDGTVTGAGIVLAQRLEQLSRPGGVTLHGAVYDATPRRLPLVFQDLGPQSLKGFSEATRAYAVEPAPGSVIPAPESGAVIESSPRKLGTFHDDAIAVLPFENLSNDPEQEYFSDGLAEDIITALSYCQAFPVIARNSTFSFKGESIQAQRVARALGARYILNGSVRKAGNRVRVSAQLIDGETALHLWAEKFDRSLEDIFDLQDELTERIAATVQPALTKAVLERSMTKRPESLRAWDYYLHGTSYLNKGALDNYEIARESFQKAIDLEPNYADAWAGLASAHLRTVRLMGGDVETIEKGFQAAKKAVASDDNSAFAHLILGTGYLWKDELQLGISQVRKALQINPYFAQAQMALGNRLDLAGETEEGIRQMERALELNRRDPTRDIYFSCLSRANTSRGDHEAALHWINEAVGVQPEDSNLRYRLALCLANLDAVDAAREALEECERLQPGSVSRRKAWAPYTSDDRNQQLLAGLRRHGLLAS